MADAAVREARPRMPSRAVVDPTSTERPEPAERAVVAQATPAPRRGEPQHLGPFWLPGRR